MRLVIGDLIDEKGLKKNYVAEQLGVNKATLSKWINGRVEPSFFKMVRLSKLLDVKLEDLYEE